MFYTSMRKLQADIIYVMDIYWYMGYGVFLYPENYKLLFRDLITSVATAVIYVSVTILPALKFFG